MNTTDDNAFGALAVKTKTVIGPVFPWEFPEPFDLLFHRESCGYWQAWGFRPDIDESIIAVDVIIDRYMWE